MAEALLGEFVTKIEGLTLIPSSGGRHEVTVDGDLIYSKLSTGRHPEIAEIKDAARLWGEDTEATLEALASQEDRSSIAMAIGPAGEITHRRRRIMIVDSRALPEKICFETITFTYRICRL